MKKILIFVGKGKSTITEYITEKEPVIYGIKELIKKSDKIKELYSRQYMESIVVHLESENDIKKIPLGIRRRALIFKINF